MSGMIVYCPRCEREVEVGPEHLTPTLPPTQPNMPTMIWLRDVVGHECRERDLVAKQLSDIAGP